MEYLFSPAEVVQKWRYGHYDTFLRQRGKKINASIFAREHLGYVLTFDRLLDTSPGSGLAFRPLDPRLETKLYLVWKKYQTFSPIAERFLTQIRTVFLPGK